MFRIAICDDEQDVCGFLESLIISCTHNLKIKPETEVFNSGETLLEYINNGNRYDVIFLDIEMETLNGIEFGNCLRRELSDEETRIVYISWKKSYAMDLFKVRPYDFLVKPLKERADEIVGIVTKIYDDVLKDEQYYMFNVGKQTCKEYLKDILYFESSNRVVNIIKENESIRFYSKLDLVEKELEDSYFLRIHKSVLINVKHVNKFESNKVYMDNGQVLGISKSYRGLVNAYNMKYWGTWR